MYLIVREGGAFGDNLLSAWMCKILNENHIDTHYYSRTFDPRRYFENIIIKTPGNTYEEFPYSCVGAYTSDMVMFDWVLNEFKKKYGIIKELKRGNVVPVIYRDEPSIGGVDVVLNTKTSSWIPWRMWNGFPQLKELLKQKGITFIDLDQGGYRDNTVLNYVKKSKLYLGLETGTSHYVSSVVNKSLIIQSGFVKNSFWNIYGYDFMENKVDCAPCHLKGKECRNSYSCINEINPNEVFKKILEKL